MFSDVKIEYISPIVNAFPNQLKHGDLSGLFLAKWHPLLQVQLKYS